MAAFRPVADALKSVVVEVLADTNGSLFVMQVPSEMCETLGVVAQRMGCTYKKVSLI